MNIIPEMSPMKVMLAVGVLAAALLVGCGSSSGASGTHVRVVASTNVYGDVAARLGGSRVSVTSIIADPDQDPHSYEANARTQLALSRADIVIENGGGYDDFVDRMLSSAGKSPTTINVVHLSGKRAPAGGELNEHVWYDFATMHKLAAQLVHDFSAADPRGAATYRGNARTFDAGLARLEAREARVKAAHAGEGVAITEPVPLYLLAACGLVNRTPAQFSAAIEDGTGVPVRVLDQTLGLFHSHAVKLLAYNEQTSGAETKQVLAAAKADHVPVVPVTETLPAGKHYLAWMGDNLHAVAAALG